FPNFDIEDDFELEFIPRPKSFNSNLFYQEYEDTIDYPLISMIQQGFIKLNQGIKDNFQSIDNQELLYSSILGLVYVTGLRPVQLTKLSVQDIKVDTTRTIDQFHRYSVLIPYAKQARYVHEKIAVKLPEEIAEIILSYIERFNLYPDEKLFDMGENAARFCSKAINTQLFAFSPKSYRDAVLAGEMIRQKYSFSDFRHHVGYSLAMAGSSAEEIAYILGHSSVVTARHYIFSTPQLAQIRAQALGRNSLYKHMIAMLLTGRLVYKQEWKHKKVMGNIGHKIHYDIGGCSYNDKCLFQPVRNCYGCIYFHPFIDADHSNVLESIQCEINDLIRLSDGIGVSRNPLIRVHESTKFEIESVIVRCKIQKDDI
ncbi:site-specific integrase, partial [Acinetobacter baumannii]